MLEGQNVRVRNSQKTPTYPENAHRSTFPYTAVEARDFSKVVEQQVRVHCDTSKRHHARGVVSVVRSLKIFDLKSPSLARVYPAP